jgi:hypothetical protein
MELVVRTTPLVVLCLLVAPLAGCTDTSIGKLGDPPQVNFVRPSDGSSFDPLGTVEVCLQVKDEADPADLQVLLESDVDGVLVDSPAAFGACTGGNLGVGISLSAATHVLSVTVVDPENASDTASVTLTPIPDSPPRCTVWSPEAAELVVAGDPVPFSATVEDDETPAAELEVVWESDLDGVLYSGSPDSTGALAFTETALSTGAHLLTLAVTDARANTERCTTDFTVDACTDDDDDGFTTCDGDCDDTDASVYPGALEILDGQDNDCDDIVDEETDLVDDDGDGYSELDGDCDDTDAEVHPNATEVWYDGVDSDCDESSDYDADRDGQDAVAYSGTDCDDTDATVYTGASETWYDGVDGDCSGGSDYDADGDGFDAASHGGTDCDDGDVTAYVGATDTWYDGVDSDCAGDNDYDADGDGYLSDAYGGSDCDDTNRNVSPGALDTWYDGVDANCDGASDYDRDRDGYDSDSYGGSDCDDSTASVHPGATEVWYDGVDTDCDSASDYDADGDGHDSQSHGGDDCNDGLASVHPGATDTWYDGLDSDCGGDNDYDADADGYLADSYGGTDCDDTDLATHPGATEIWYDGVDGNCDGSSDYDADRDGYDSDGYAGTDCDDSDGGVNPGESEVWYDGVDADCDGASDYDADGDGDEADAYGGADCDDTDATVWTGATELRDGLDNDCDDYCDEGLLSAGDLVITELLKDPSAVSDTTGEWFEVTNITSTDIRMCAGWEAYDDDVDSFLFVSDIFVPAGASVVFGRSATTSATGGITVDYNFGSGMQLANGADEIVLYFDDPDGTPFEMSRVEYLDGPAWPDTAGKSISLDPDFTTETDNDSVGNWCHGTTTFGAGDVGTPGDVNDEC